MIFGRPRIRRRGQRRARAGRGRLALATRRRLAFAAAALAGTAIALRSRPRYRFGGRSVVITGGSRGLGLVLARALAREGARLSLIARDRRALEDAALELRGMGADVLAVACDVSSRVDVEHAIEEVVQRYGAVDVLINDAGVIQVGPIENMSLTDFQQALDVHLWGAVYTIWAALPQMRRQGGGRIVNIASIGGKIAVPHLLPYTVSKFAVVGLSEGLRHELRKDNIKVTTVCPGLMRTGSHVRALLKGQHENEYGWFAVLSSSRLTSMDADRAAAQILDACRRGDAELIVTTQARLAVLLNGLMPNVVSGALSLVGRLLPGPTNGHGHEARSALASRPGWTRPFTRLSDRAARRNREI
jgi:NAD(P)-dependent dehydrogenase (short-subunit alcohol dehydrogenase family)